MQLLLSRMNSRMLPVIRHRITFARSLCRRTSRPEVLPARKNFGIKSLELNSRIDNINHLRETRITTAFMAIRNFSTKKATN